jgi:D-tyrosyl-tRNA(Tyr) deacylase
MVFSLEILGGLAMRAVVQRVKSASLRVDGELISEISFGLVVFFGVRTGDGKEQADYIAKKIAALRIFEDENGKMNLSVKDVGGEVLFVSQFTLYGDLSHGNRPSFTLAERPEKASPLYDYAAEKLSAQGVPVKKGVFGVDMKIEQMNDGPVTILLED